MKRRASIALTVLLLSLAHPGSRVQGGPPFLTDDPVPVEYHHNEFYLFSTFDATKDDSTVQAPAFEYNYGIIPETQIHVVVPFTCFASNGNTTEYGFGDMELGFKYRFLKETDDWPQLGVFPMLEVPSGDASRGLGNGRAWTRLPLWAQKSCGPWTTCGGIGYAINPAPGQRNHLFGGWLLQRELSKKLTLGGEVYFQGADSADAESSALFNLGGYYSFNEHLQLLFTGGHTLVGEQHTVAYLGLYRTW
jgi:hypothetical protein